MKNKFVASVVAIVTIAICIGIYISGFSGLDNLEKMVTDFVGSPVEVINTREVEGKMLVSFKETETEHYGLATLRKNFLQKYKVLVAAKGMENKISFYTLNLDENYLVVTGDSIDANTYGILYYNLENGEVPNNAIEEVAYVDISDENFIDIFNIDDLDFDLENEKIIGSIIETDIGEIRFIEDNPEAQGVKGSNNSQYLMVFVLASGIVVIRYFLKKRK